MTTFLKVKNRAVSTLDGGINDVAVSLDVAVGEGALFPTTYPFHITIEDEILSCTNVAGDTLTVVREVEGTAAAAHGDGVAVQLNITAQIVTELQAVSGGGLYGINVETLAGDKTLTPGTDEIYQYLDEGGANRIITLDTASAVAGDRFVIRHNGAWTTDNYLEIKQAAISLDRVFASNVKQYIFDGTNWICADHGSGENDSKKENLAIGYRARGTQYGVALGSLAVAYLEGVAVGNNAQGYSRGVALGYQSNGTQYGVALGDTCVADSYGVAAGYKARGNSYGVALGYEANTNAKKYSIALGYYSECERYGETSTNINGGDSDQENNVVQGRWEGQLAGGAGATEIFCAGQANQRFTIRPSSVLAFEMIIVARDNVANEGAMYTFEGLIKRDAAGNTVLAVANKTVIWEDDATWDCAVTADDGNEALIITVTGDGANITQWCAVLNGCETHF